MAAGSRNVGAVTRKNTRMTAAPTSEPTSGRLSSRAPSERWETRSSTGDGGLVSISVMMTTSLAGAVGGELLHRTDVGLVDERRTGQGGLATTDRVAVGLVEPKTVNRQVALQIRLLVDGELNVARLDCPDQVLVGVERRHLRRGSGVLDRL